MPNNDHLSDNLPWGEAQWQKFMARSEMRAAKYGELLETLRDHPDCETLIDHEMGRDDPEEDGNFSNEELFVVPEMSDDEAAEYAAEEEKRHAELEAMPAYAAASDFGMKLHDALRPLAEALYEKLGDAEPDGRDLADYNLVIALRNCFVPAARLVGSHSMSDEDDSLGGAIVKCKQSLQAAQDTLGALEKLRELNALPATFDALIEENRHVCGLIAEHLAALRARVWWE